MHSYSLADSPSSEKLNKQISYSQVAKDYVERNNDQIIQDLEQLIRQSNPKQGYQRISTMRTKEINLLKEQNKKLREKNQQFERKLYEANEKIKRLSNGSPKNQNEKGMDIQSPQNSKSHSSSSSDLKNIPDSLNYTPDEQRLKLQGIEIMHQQARQIENLKQQQFEKLNEFLQIVFGKLIRISQLQNMQPTIKKDGVQKLNYARKETVTISKQKYKVLIDFYVNTVVDTQRQRNHQNGIKQFSFENSQSKDQSLKTQLLDKSDDLETLFASVAVKNNLQKQWSAYLKSRKEEAETFKQEIKNILGDKSDNQQVHKQIDSINQTQITHLENQLQNNHSLSKVTKYKLNQSQNKIEDILFKKLTKIVEILGFTQMQKQLFMRFDQKRIHGRLFHLDDFLEKFKNKQDVTEISSHYSSLIVRFTNSLLISVMAILCQQSHTSLKNVLDESPLKWLKQKLDNKFFHIKDRLFRAIENSSLQYLSQKHDLSDKEKQANRNSIKPFSNPIFDQNNELKNEMIKIVTEYKQLLESCVVNTNKRIVLGVL